MELYLVRHGQSMAQTGEDNSPDPPLSKKGLLQAEMLGKSLSGIKFDKIYSSSLSRALGTAAGVAKNQKEHLPIEIIPELGECGVDPFWEPDEKIQREIYEDLTYHKKSIGRIFENDRERALFALKETVFKIAYESGFDECKETNEGTYKNNSSKILIAAHGMFNAFLLGILVNFPFDENMVVEQRNTCINRFSLYTVNGVRRVKFSSFNDTSHLSKDIDTRKSVNQFEA